MQTFQLFGQQVSILECIGFAFGVIGVWLTIKQNILCFPVGIINVAIYAFIFFSMSWLANALLQIAYLFVLVYGWIRWKKSATHDELSVTATQRSTMLVLVIIGIGSSILFGYTMKETTNNPLPYWDAATTSMGLIAQWMVARKKVENWLVWIAANIIVVGMCLYQSLYLHQPFYLTAILYFIYFIQAIKGYVEWKKVMRQRPLSGLH